MDTTTFTSAERVISGEPGFFREIEPISRMKRSIGSQRGREIERERDDR